MWFDDFVKTWPSLYPRFRSRRRGTVKMVIAIRAKPVTCHEIKNGTLSKMIAWPIGAI